MQNKNNANSTRTIPHDDLSQDLRHSILCLQIRRLFDHRLQLQLQLCSMCTGERAEKTRPNPWETFCAVPCCCSLSLYLLCYVSAHPAVQQHASECIDCILLEFNRPNVLFCVSVNCCCWGPKNQFWAIPIWPWPRCICSKALEATGTQQQQKVANVCVWRIAHR